MRGRNRGIIYLGCIAVLGLCPLGARQVSAACDYVAEMDAPLDFNTAVEIALHCSPQMRQGMIQLDVRRLDERDARAEFWPSIYLQAGYMINAPSEASSPYSLHLVTGEYNPLGAFFSLRAQREVTRLTQLVYLQAIADGLQQTAELFLSLAALDRARTIQDEQLNWTRRYVTWCTNRLEQGGTLLELRMAEQELRALQVEIEKAEVRQQQAQRSLASLLGVEADETMPTVYAATAREQVLGECMVDLSDRDRAEIRAMEVQILDVRMRLQKLGVLAAYAEYVPRPTFALRTTDPLNETQEQGLFFSAGLSFPLWDAGRRRRNIRRQRAMLEHQGLERVIGREAWRRRWSEIHDNRELAVAEAALADQRVKVAELNYARQELTVESGRDAWPNLFSARQKLDLARLQALEKELAVDRAELALRHMCRDLLDRYIIVSNLPDELEDVLSESVLVPEK